MSCIVTGTLKKSSNPFTHQNGHSCSKQSLFLAAQGCQTSALLGGGGQGPLRHESPMLMPVNINKSMNKHYKYRLV